MESDDSVKTEDGKVVCSSTKVQKLFKHMFYLVVPFSPSFLAHLTNAHCNIPIVLKYTLLISFPCSKVLRDDHTSKHHVFLSSVYDVPER